MVEAIRAQVLATLQNDWATYAARFHHLSPEAQATFLARQGYARLADLLAHIIAWWTEGSRAVENLLTDPDVVSQDYDVDGFNAQAVSSVRELEEAAVIESFEAMRQRMVRLVMSLPEAAFRQKQLADRLQIEVIGHYAEHALVESKVSQSNVALLVIDVQRGLFEKSTPIYKAEQLLQNITSLVDRAHRRGAPVFYVQHSDLRALAKGSPDWQLHPRLQPLATDYVIHKQHGNAFEDTALEQTLKSGNITTLVITGLVTHGCVRATCMGARQLGYKVILVEDGHSNYSKQAAKLIEEWNLKLGAQQVELKPTSEVEFS